MSDAEFIELFYQVVERRRSQGLEDWRSHLVLAEAERVGAGPWEIDFLARSRDGGVEPERAACNEGTCRGCRRPVRSWARAATCPVCGRVVHCN